MRRTAFVLIVLTGFAAPAAVRAQVIEDNFQLRNTGDLVALCMSKSTDRMFTAAQNFCQGFAVGTYRSLQAEETARQTPLFCPPAQVTLAYCGNRRVRTMGASVASAAAVVGDRRDRGLSVGEIALQACPLQKLKEESMSHGRSLGLLSVFVLLTGCAGMTDTQQRATTGTVGGAAAGAVLGAIGGNAGLGAVAGAGAGLVGGLLVDHAKKEQQASYNQGYAAGQTAR